MSIQEIREFCESIVPYQLRVHVRLKNGYGTLIGRIVSVDPEIFQLKTDDGAQESVRYAHVASVKSS